MALPTLTKTWEFDVNHAPISSITELMFQMKNKLIGNGAFAFTTPPTVKSSSNASVADNTDNWASASDVTFQEPPGAFSWIVFDCSAVQPGLEMAWFCEDNPGGGAVQWEVFMSDAAGFTGGTTTARPTAADQINTFSGGSPSELDGSSTLGSAPARLHVAQSSDGQILRIWAYTANVTLGFWELARPKNTASLWVQPWVHNNSWYKYNSGGNAAQMTYGKLALNTTYYLKTYAGGLDSRVKYTGEAFATATAEVFIGLQQGHTEDLEPDDCFPILPMGIYSQIVGSRGRIGEVVDMWWAASILDDGSHIPSDASLQFVVVNDVIIPWAGVSAGQMAKI